MKGNVKTNTKTAKLLLVVVMTVAAPVMFIVATLSLSDRVDKAMPGSAYVGYIVGRAGGSTNDLESVVFGMQHGNTNVLSDWLADRIEKARR